MGRGGLIRFLSIAVLNKTIDAIYVLRLTAKELVWTFFILMALYN